MTSTILILPSGWKICGTGILIDCPYCSSPWLIGKGFTVARGGRVSPCVPCYSDECDFELRIKLHEWDERQYHPDQRILT